MVLENFITIRRSTSTRQSSTYSWSKYAIQWLRIRKRIHPTQKPVSLYRWLLHNYAKEGQKILDTHGGSMSSAIACHQMGFDLTLCELDKDYYEAGVNLFQVS